SPTCFLPDSTAKLHLHSFPTRRSSDLHFMHSGRDYKVDELGFNQLQLNPKPQLSAGEVGYIVAGVKSVQDIEIGDTLTLLDRPRSEEHTSELQSREKLVCRLLLEKKKD